MELKHYNICIDIFYFETNKKNKNIENVYLKV